MDMVVQRFGGNVPTVDAFASRQNQRFPRFWDSKQNAFSKDWSLEDLLWINPPFDKIKEVVHKLEADEATAIVVVPEWKDTTWWRKLQRLVVDSFLFNKEEPIFLREGVVLMKPPSWRTWAFLVHGALVPPPLHVRSVLAHYMRAWPDGEVGKLTPTEVGLIERQCARYQTPLCGVRSVLRTGTQEGDLSPSILESIAQARSALLEDYGQDVLSGKLPRDPPVRGPFGLAKIDLVPGARPKRHRSFKMVGEREEALKQILEEYCDMGWLEPSFSEWGSPCFILPKKASHEWRLVVDYRALNQVSAHDAYELPLIPDMLHKHCHKRMFTVLDMKKGYHQMPLDPLSRPLTAMATHIGLLQWRVMPMGAKNGNSAFQRENGVGAGSLRLRLAFCR